MSVKISSLYELKHEIAKLVRIIKRKTGQDAFNVTIQNHLVELTKYIRERVKRILELIFTSMMMNIL